MNTFYAVKMLAETCQCLNDVKCFFFCCSKVAILKGVQRIDTVKEVYFKGPYSKICLKNCLKYLKSSDDTEYLKKSVGQQLYLNQLYGSPSIFIYTFKYGDP